MAGRPVGPVDRRGLVPAARPASVGPRTPGGPGARAAGLHHLRGRRGPVRRSRSDRSGAGGDRRGHVGHGRRAEARGALPSRRLGRGRPLVRGARPERGSGGAGSVRALGRVPDPGARRGIAGAPARADLRVAGHGPGGVRGSDADRAGSGRSARGARSGHAAPVGRRSTPTSRPSACCWSAAARSSRSCSPPPPAWADGWSRPTGSPRPAAGSPTTDGSSKTPRRASSTGRSSCAARR